MAWCSVRYAFAMQEHVYEQKHTYLRRKLGDFHPDHTLQKLINREHVAQHTVSFGVRRQQMLWTRYGATACPPYIGVPVCGEMRYMNSARYPASEKCDLFAGFDLGPMWKLPDSSRVFRARSHVRLGFYHVILDHIAQGVSHVQIPKT